MSFKIAFIFRARRWAADGLGMVAASRPSDEGRRGPPEFLPRGSQAILHAWRDLRVHGSGEKARALEVPQASRERLRANRPEPALELRVPQAAVVREGPDDQCGSLLRNSGQDAFEEMRTYIAGQADEGAFGGPPAKSRAEYPSGSHSPQPPWNGQILPDG